MLTHGNMVANMLQADAWIGNSVKQGEEVIITALPLYHIFSLTANGLVFMRLGGLELADHQSARHARLRQGAEAVRLHRAHRRQHAVQRPAQYTGLRRAGFLAPAPEPWRRHGGAARRGRTLEEGHRLHPRRSLWPDRNLAGGMHQSARPEGIQRLDRPADTIHRCRHLVRRGPTAGARRGGRTDGARPAGDEGLLAAPGRNRQGACAPMAGCIPATSPGWTKTATSISSIARRT